jgi:NADPH-dependent FMN reductase
MQNMEDPKGGVKVREGQGSTQLPREEFERRWKVRFRDPAFDGAKAEIDKLAGIAWEAYNNHRKSPLERKAGPEFEDPDQDLAIEWLEARKSIIQAQMEQMRANSPSRILLICGSPRSDESCPSEMSKTFRIASIAYQVMTDAGFDIDFLDLSHVNSEFGRTIFPCKACVSTAMPLCHWPCSCYPNYAMGQVNDWMNDIYPRWVAAHGGDDCNASPLVPISKCPKIDDGSPSLCRWRQS